MRIKYIVPFAWGAEGVAVRDAQVPRDRLAAGTEEEGYNAMVMDSISDSGLSALWSRLTIPVIGPILASYAMAALGLSHSKRAFPTPATSEDDVFRRVVPS